MLPSLSPTPDTLLTDTLLAEALLTDTLFTRPGPANRYLINRKVELTFNTDRDVSASSKKLNDVKVRTPFPNPNKDRTRCASAGT
ncbi:hypothetical protein HMPREF3175_04670 [Arthrobacter sp. HMSC08H08]|nr:hypothetical protein HMPREF3175_04670 [Arthrobacter sp. HMSC08H08]